MGIVPRRTKHKTNTLRADPEHKATQATAAPEEISDMSQETVFKRTRSKEVHANEYLVKIQVQTSALGLLHDLHGRGAVLHPPLTLEQTLAEQTLAVDEGVPDNEVHVLGPDDGFHNLHIFL